MEFAQPGFIKPSESLNTCSVSADAVEFAQPDFIKPSESLNTCSISADAVEFAQPLKEVGGRKADFAAGAIRCLTYAHVC